MLHAAAARRTHAVHQHPRWSPSTAPPAAASRPSVEPSPSSSGCRSSTPASSIGASWWRRSAPAWTRQRPAALAEPGQADSRARASTPIAPIADADSVSVDGVADSPCSSAIRATPGFSPRISSTPAVRAAVLQPRSARWPRTARWRWGRDCGTVVFPNAAVKFYLKAPQSVREERRLAQLRARGAPADHSMLRAEVAERDRADTDRAASPLTPAPDAHVIDTAQMDVQTMIARALALCHDAGLDPVPAH